MHGRAIYRELARRRPSPDARKDYSADVLWLSIRGSREVPLTGMSLFGGMTRREVRRIYNKLRRAWISMGAPDERTPIREFAA